MMYQMPILSILLILSVFSDCTGTTLNPNVTDVPRMTKPMLRMKKPMPRIVGGKTCKERTDIKSAFLISLRKLPPAPYNTYYYNHCGASLVTPVWVLTAGHCESKEPMWAVQASRVTSPWYNGPLVQVVKQIIHPSYDMFHIQYDIGLVLLEWPIKLDTADYAKLPRKRLEGDYMSALKHCNGKLQVMGLGAITTTLDQPFEMMCADITLMNFTHCATLLEEYRTVPGIEDDPKSYYGHLCCEPGTPNFYVGDSGGPATCKGIQYGIVSWGAGSKPYWPSVMTRVDVFLDDFIRPNMEKYRSNSEKISSIVAFFVCFIPLLLLL